MKTKKKISVTIDEGISEAVHQVSLHFQMPLSQLAQEAFTLWLKKQGRKSDGSGVQGDGSRG